MRALRTCTFLSGLLLSLTQIMAIFAIKAKYSGSQVRQRIPTRTGLNSQGLHVAILGPARTKAISKHECSTKGWSELSNGHPLLT